MAASDSAGGDGIRLHAAAEEESASVVGEVAVAVAEAADLFEEQVDGFGRSVRCAAGGVEGEDLVPPAVDGVREPGEFGDVGVGGVFETDQPAFRVGGVRGRFSPQGRFGWRRTRRVQVGVLPGSAVLGRAVALRLPGDGRRPADAVGVGCCDGQQEEAH